MTKCVCGCGQCMWVWHVGVAVHVGVACRCGHMHASACLVKVFGSCGDNKNLHVITYIRTYVHAITCQHCGSMHVTCMFTEEVQKGSHE